MSDSRPGAAGAFSGRSRVRWDRLRQLLAPAAVFFALLLVIAVAVPTFLGGGGPSIIAQQATPILLLALGQCVVLMIGSIDLSNGAMALFSCILTALTLGPLGVAAPVLCVAAVTLIELPPEIRTLSEASI